MLPPEEQRVSDRDIFLSLVHAEKLQRRTSPQGWTPKGRN
jgi:hypothetical protein